MKPSDRTRADAKTRGAGSALGLLAALCLPIIALANADAAGADYNESDLFTDLSLSTTASRLAQPRRGAPASLSIIDRAMIEASGAQEISDLLRLVPGFQAYHVNGHKFGVTSHGLGMTHPGRLEVMVNGRSAYIAALSSTDWRALGIAIEDVERIEVARGPSVVSWGTNAFLAAINIITREPTGLPDQRIDLTLGDSGRNRFSAATEGLLGNSAVRLSGGYYDAPGFSNEDAGQGGHLNLHSVSSPTLHDRVALQLSVSKGRLGVGDRYEPFISQRNYLSHQQLLSWQHEADRVTSELRLFHNRLRYAVEPHLLSELTGLPPLTLAMLGIPDELSQTSPEQGTTERFDIEFNQQHRLSSQLRAFWGIGWRHDTGQTPFLLNTDQTLSEDYRHLFANLEWQASPQLTTHLGLLAEASDSSSARLSPRLALNYHLDEQQSVRAIWSRAHRAPSLLEAEQDTRFKHSNGRLIAWRRAADPALSAETIDSIEFGYLRYFLAGRGSLDLRLFQETVEDGIALPTAVHNEPQALDPLSPSGSLQWLTLNSNVAQWRSRGLEVELDLKLSNKNLLALRYSYLDLADQAVGAYSDPDLPFKPPLNLADTAPRHLFTALASHSLGEGVQLSGTFYHVPALQWINGSSTAHYNRLDLRLAKQIPMAGGRLQTALVIQNLGARYTEFQQRNPFDTRAFLTLSWQAR